MPLRLNKLPTFSVIIPVYNRVEPLKRALESVLSQSLQSFEVIVVDDGSESFISEKIRLVIEQLKDSRIRLLRHSNNINGAAARNTGIRAATASTISFLDSDDTWHAKKLESVQQIIIDNGLTGQDFLIHHQYVNIENDTIGEPYPPKAKDETESVAHYSFVTNDIGGIQSSTISVSAKLAKNNLFNEQLRGHQDWDFCLKIGKVCGTFLFIPDVLTYRYQDSTDSVARTLNWMFSLTFYSHYRQYFSDKEAAYYLNRVVLKKAKYAVSFRKLLLSKLTFRVALKQPKIFFEVFFNYFTNYISLSHRVKKFYRQCEKNRIRNIAIWGMNNYCRALINEKPNNVFIKFILDAKFTHGNSAYLGVKLSNLESIERDEMKSIDALVLATDRHQQSMKGELSKCAPQLLGKVYEF